MPHHGYWDSHCAEVNAGSYRRETPKLDQFADKMTLNFSFLGRNCEDTKRNLLTRTDYSVW